MNDTPSGLIAKLAQNPFGSDNGWIVAYVNSVTLTNDLWRKLAARKPTECAEIIARFAAKVHIADGCWVWTGSRTGSNKHCQHGQFALYHGENIYAHRLSYLLFNGPIPEGRLVRHTCDVPYCVRPSHLLVGTQKDNLQDAVERNRLPKYRAPRKLSSEQVIEMRRKRMRGALLRDLAAYYGVSIPCASNVCALKTRQHLPETARVLAARRQAS